MNPFDILAAVIVCFCLIRGIFRGLIKEMASIIGVFAGYYAGYTYYPHLSRLLSKWLAKTAYVDIISFMILFSAVYILVSILGIIIKYFMRISFLGWVDRICGAGFGVVKGILIAVVILVALTAFLPAGSTTLKRSLLASRLSFLSEKMVLVVKKDMKRSFSIRLEDLKKSWHKP